MKKIAIPSRDNMVDEHFGHCDYYSIYSINDKNEIISDEILASPNQCGCKSGIASVLSEIGVSIMLAGNMGEGAVNVLSQYGITVIRGCSGEVTSVVNQFINGKLFDSGESCNQHHSCKN